MIYVETSVALAYLLVEERRPPVAFGRTPSSPADCSNTRSGAGCTGGRAGPLGGAARELLARIAMIELSPLVLARALEPFPEPVRTLDALHLASLEFLRQRRLEPALASYDQRLLRAARSIGIAILELD